MREIKHLSIHQWICFAIPDSQQPTSPIGFLFLKLPPPPCAVLLVGYSQTQWLINMFLSKTGHLGRCRPSRQRIGGVKRAASSCVRQCTGNQPFPSCGHWLEQPGCRSATNTWATDVLKQSELNIIPCLRYAHLHEVVEWKSDNLCRCLSESLKYLNNTIDKSIKQH